MKRERATAALVCLWLAACGCGGGGGGGPTQGTHGAGESCSSTADCAPGLGCVVNVDGVTSPGICFASTTLSGTITLPSDGAGQPALIRLTRSPDAAAGYADKSADGTSPAKGPLTYTMNDVVPGHYYLFAMVDMDGSGGTRPTPGDFAGWYGQDASGNAPAMPNVVIPATGGPMTLDFTLTVR